MSRSEPTVRDVAERAGVSSATVSRVMNDAPNVDKQLARRVREAVKATGYVPNAAGRSLRARSSSQIAVLIPDADNPYFSQVVSEVEPAARSAGYSVMLCHTGNEPDQEQTYLDQIVARRMAGVIAIPSDENWSGLTPLTEANIPVVLVDRRLPDVEVDRIATDNMDAGRQAAVHLRDKGFRRPACITGPETLTTTEDRLLGFSHAWSTSAGGAPALYRGDLHFDSGFTAMTEILDDGDIDCVFVTNNRMSAGAFQAIRGLLSPPALLATDDDIWTRLVTPSVSVIQQPIRDTGRLAAQMLIDRIAAPNEMPRTTLLSSKVIERESTAGGPPPRG